MTNKFTENHFMVSFNAMPYIKFFHEAIDLIVVVAYSCIIMLSWAL